jgi:hypothetical protein
LFFPASFKWLTLLDKYAFHNVLITNKQKKTTTQKTQKNKNKTKQNKNKKTNKQIFPVIK